MSATKSPLPSAKRRKTSVYATLPADEFVSKMELLKGPEVKIIVVPTKKAFSLHKRLLCISSSYFDRAFNGGFLESKTQEIHLEDMSIQSFELVVQFLYTGSITLFSSVNTWDGRVTHLLQFFGACDRFDIPTSKLIVDQLKDVLLSIPRNAYPSRSHIKEVADLPAGNEVRKLIVDACLKPYALWIRLGCKIATPRDREFNENIKEFPGFASDLLYAYATAARAGCTYRGGLGLYDPLRNEAF
ncbi:hypothetical protein ACMFMG_000667 [Clarireedia jacksonii]